MERLGWVRGSGCGGVSVGVAMDSTEPPRSRWPTLAHRADLMRAGTNPRRDTPQMGTVMTCGNVEGMLVVNQELALPSHDEKA